MKSIIVGTLGLAAFALLAGLLLRLGPLRHCRRTRKKKASRAGIAT